MPFLPKLSGRHYIKFWLSNDAGEEPQILDYELNVKAAGRSWANCSVEEDGSFALGDEKFFVPGWQAVCTELLQTARELDLLDYFTVSIALDDKGGFTFLHFPQSHIGRRAASARNITTISEARQLTQRSAWAKLP